MGLIRHHKKGTGSYCCVARRTVSLKSRKIKPTTGNLDYIFVAPSTIDTPIN